MWEPSLVCWFKPHLVHQQACLLLAKSEVFGPGTVPYAGWLTHTFSHFLTLTINYNPQRIWPGSHKVCETICTQSVWVVERRQRQFDELKKKKKRSSSLLQINSAAAFRSDVAFCLCICNMCVNTQQFTGLAGISCFLTLNVSAAQIVSLSAWNKEMPQCIFSPRS